ncbi:MAG: molybdopterin-dependent oxidoreductase, partial [Anaerolineales bacterium]|nr:molybdopterin-dependent oxidoreductase [Anaerolineales bacterium]
GVYERVRRAIKLRIGRPHWEPIYEIITATDPATPAAAGLPPSIAQTPDLDGWIRINADETVTIFSGKVEIGQGIKTAVSQIAAEELDVALSRICIISGDTGQVPDEGLTAGSMSVEVSGRALRVAAAEARHWLLTLAFEELEASDLTNLQINDGVITDPATGRQTSYWKLMGGKRFGRTISGTIPPKDPAAYTLIGQPAPRADLLPKLTGVPSYVHDLELPGMVHGRVVRPPSYGARLVAVEETAVSQPIAYVEYRDWGKSFGVREISVQPGHSLRAVALFLIRHLEREAKRLNPERKKPYQSIHFHFGDDHPVYEALKRELPSGRSPYAWYIRVPDLPGFLRHITPVLEKRLAGSVMAGHTGTLKLNFYRSQMTLVFDKGELTEIGTYEPERVEAGDAVFPDLTFLKLLFGHRSLEELDAARADCYANNEATVLLPILFPKRPSRLIELG